MSELSDGASVTEQLASSLSVWFADDGSTLICREELDVPLDLHTACSIGQYDVVAECIRRGDVDLNGKNLGGWTPLMYAAYIGHDNIVNLLLEYGVNVNASTAKGLTPLMLAATCGNESIAYFLLQQGAELESKDERGWTALLHTTSTGHQQMARFLLDNNANANIKEPVLGFTPLMDAAASGHEIIVQCLLDHGAQVEDRNFKGETARALAMMYGYRKIAGLVDMHCVRAKSGTYDELSSSEEDNAVQRPRCVRGRARGPSIHDGPQAMARFRVVPKNDSSLAIRNRDVTSPINELDGQSNSSRDEAFFDNDMPTMRRSCSSSEGLPCLLGLSREASLESKEDSDQAKRSCPRRPNKLHHSKKKKKRMKERGDDRPLKTITETTEEASKQENTELSPEQQLSRELDWCIEQLELGLRTQKSSNKQREEATRALKTLRSSKAPVVKKRQVMRAVSGDYRKKMDEERDRQFKLMHSAMTSAKVTAMSEPSHKSMFHCRALSKRPTASMENPQATRGPSPTVEPSEGECENFVFRPSHEEFCFNFNL